MCKQYTAAAASSAAHLCPTSLVVVASHKICIRSATVKKDDSGQFSGHFKIEVWQRGLASLGIHISFHAVGSAQVRLVFRYID